jgi:hypothetical protein
VFAVVEDTFVIDRDLSNRCVDPAGAETIVVVVAVVACPSVSMGVSPEVVMSTNEA